MDTFTVTFFGHRDFCEHSKYEEKLEEIIRSVLSSHTYINLLIGRNGEFDTFATSVIKRILKEREDDFYTCLTLVLPYPTAEYKNSAEYFEEYYDSIEICHSSRTSHFKSAITIRNHEMIDRSDLVIFYSKESSGGTASALKYARKQNKQVINLCLC